MMKPPFKASDSAINLICAPWFDMFTVWFVASLIKLYKHEFEVIKYILVKSCQLVQYQAYNHLALQLSDYKRDIALMA